MSLVTPHVLTGGRGKAGGVKLAKSPAEARELANKILGMKINGLTVYTVLVTAAADIASEAYVGIILDRATKKPVFMVSPAGGIDIEEVAAKTPERSSSSRSTRGTGCSPIRPRSSASSSSTT